MARKRGGQLGLVFGGWRGQRRGKAKGGRPPKGAKPMQTHAKRPHLSGREPVHVTWRVTRDVWNMQSKRAFRELLARLVRANEKGGMRLTHFSVQANHLHFIIEPASTSALSRGMQGLGVRLAKALNKLMGRQGKIFADRFFARALRTREEAKNAILYVFGNSAKHAREHGIPMRRGTPDFCIGGPGGWLQGWKMFQQGGPEPISPPETRVLRSLLWLTPAHCR